MGSEHHLIQSPVGVTFRRVLVGYDGSNQAQRALRLGTALAADLDGEVHVLLVVRPAAHVETSEERAEAAEAERNNLSRGLSEVQTGFPRHVPVSTEVIYAEEPAKILASYADEHGFDIVVVGGHGREQMTHRGLGHSLEALLRNHPCPVLVV